MGETHIKKYKILQTIVTMGETHSKEETTTELQSSSSFSLHLAVSSLVSQKSKLAKISAER